MKKALTMGKKSATGSFKLSFGLASSTVILAISTIILGNILSPSELGLYALALSPASILTLFSTLGLDFALTRFTSKFQASGEEEKTRAIITYGVAFEVIVGLVMSFLCFGLTNFLASTIFGRPEASFLIAIASISIFSHVLLGITHSIFYGIERMGLSSFVAVGNSILQVTISVLLVLLGYGALAPVVGYTFSPIVFGGIGLTKVYFLLFRNKKSKTGNLGFVNSLKTMLHYGLPLSSTTIISGFLTQFYVFIMAIYFSDALIGNYKIALNFAVLLTFFSKPISTVLFPTFSKIDPKKEHTLLKMVFSSSVKYTSFLLIPATMALMALSQPIVSALFQSRYVYAPTFLTLSIIGSLFSALGSMSVSSLLSGIGETKMQMKQSILKLVLAIPLTLLLIYLFGILGLIASTFLSGLPSLFWGLHWIWKKYKVKANYRPLFRVFAAATVSALSSFLLINLLNATTWTGLILGGTVFVGCYLFALPMFGAVDKVEIQNLRSMFSGLGFIMKLLNIPLKLLERILEFQQTQGERRKTSLRDVSSNQKGKA